MESRFNNRINKLTKRCGGNEITLSSCDVSNVLFVLRRQFPHEASSLLGKLGWHSNRPVCLRTVGGSQLPGFECLDKLLCCQKHQFCGFSAMASLGSEQNSLRNLESTPEQAVADKIDARVRARCKTGCSASSNRFQV